MNRLDIGVEGTKRCPICGRRVYEPDHTYCSMKCSDAEKTNTTTAIEREVEVLMRQYRAGKWTPVD